MSPDDTTSADAPAGDTAKTGPTEEYKSIQRKLAKAQERVAELSAKDIETQVANVLTLARLEELLTAFASTQAKGTDLQKVVENIQQRREVDAKTQRTLGQITKLVEKHEVDWETDERLEAARAAYSAQKYDEALRLVEQALSVTSEEKIKELVAAGVAERMKELGRVDTGTTTVPQSTRVRRTDFNIDPRGRNAKQLAEDVNKLLDKTGLFK